MVKSFYFGLIIGVVCMAAATKILASDPEFVMRPGSIVDRLLNDPTAPHEGDIWYNMESHSLCFYDGTKIETVVAN